MPVLPDQLRPNLRVVFCGSAAGTMSALRGAYYAGRGNRFWPTLYEIGLTPRLFRPEEFGLLPGLGIGLTDLAKDVFGSDRVIRAKDEEISVALGTVFILNAFALLLFPVIGARLHLTPAQFGLWSALAIHDTSSVVGAAAKFGAEALAVGTTVKLARALWIVPVTLAAAYAKRQQARIQWPWFIVFFCAAALLNTYATAAAPLYGWLVALAKVGLRVTLFLIGTSLSLATLRKVGARPLVLGVVLWVIVATFSLWLIQQGWISI